ncbi:MAG: hypothetical protein ACLTSL_06760 [Odoribacter splanchnicus]
MGSGQKDVHNVADTTPHAVQPYEVLLLGCSAWGVGEMQDDWIPYTKIYFYRLCENNL